jgi:hypothetical protein
MPDIRSAKAQAYRVHYKSARWRETRKRQLAKQPLCETCLKAQPQRLTPATVCNHADKRTKEDPETFFQGPFTSECAPCHDSIVQSQERREDAGKLPIRPCGVDGWPA